MENRIDDDDRIVIEKAEFDYTNPDAEVVIVGITPGNSQLVNSRDGKSPKEIKRENAFAGNMRPNLIRMLDYVGINRLLDIVTCSSLWENDFDRVEMTSLLKDATFEIKTGKKVMFKDTKKIGRSKKLMNMLNQGFVADSCSYSNVRLFVALGPGVYDVLKMFKEKAIIKPPVIALAHPSGANSGRISCYLGAKCPKDNSYKWCIEKADEAKAIVKSLLNTQ